MNQNTINKIKIVADIVKQYYEPERQDRCLLWCYRNVVNKLYPMSERTFWRYISIAVEDFGYKFHNTNKEYLDEAFSKMKPDTIDKVKDLANEVLRMKPKGKTKTYLHQQISEQTGMQLNFSNFIKYLRVAEMYLGYQFNFQ